MTEDKLQSVKRSLWVYVAIALAIAAYNINLPRFYFLGIERVPYYALRSLSVVIITAILYSQTKNNIIINIPCYILYCFCVNDFLDEILFNPMEFTVSEMIVCSLFVLYGIYRYYCIYKNHKNGKF